MTILIRFRSACFILYKELSQEYPNAKIILTVRDEDSWWESMKRHIEINMYIKRELGLLAFC